MGQLVNYPHDFYDHRQRDAYRGGMGLSPSWYFTKKGDRDTWDVSSTFPHTVCVHNDFLTSRWDESAQEQARRVKVEIRTFIERSIFETVVFTVVLKDYVYVWPPSQGRDKAVMSNISHGYHLFHFATAADAILFKLKFSDYASEEADWHPKYQPDGESFAAKEEWSARHEIRKKWGYDAEPKDRSYY